MKSQKLMVTEADEASHRCALDTDLVRVLN